MPLAPKFDLSKVKKIASDFIQGDLYGVVFNAPSRSFKVVMDVLLCREREAQITIMKGLITLTEANFSSRKFQWDETYDIYGLEGFEGHNWYIKFCLYSEDERERLEEVSFHPVEQKLTLADGRILDVTWETPKEGL